MKLKTAKQQRKTNETNNWFFEKISNIDKSLTRLTNKKRTQITNIRNETGYQYRPFKYQEDSVPFLLVEKEIKKKNDYQKDKGIL